MLLFFGILSLFIDFLTSWSLSNTMSPILCVSSLSLPSLLHYDGYVPYCISAGFWNWRRGTILTTLCPTLCTPLYREMACADYFPPSTQPTDRPTCDSRCQRPVTVSRDDSPPIPNPCSAANFSFSQTPAHRLLALERQKMRRKADLEKLKNAVT